jgi:hypothetical protein
MPSKQSNVVPIVEANRLRPPSDLPQAERELFARLVASNPPEHFKESDAPLLAQYVASVILNERAAAELRREPIIDGKPSPWLVVSEKSHRACVALALRLRLSPQAWMPRPIIQKQKPPSAYDILELTDDDD